MMRERSLSTTKVQPTFFCLANPKGETKLAGLLPRHQPVGGDPLVRRPGDTRKSQVGGHYMGYYDPRHGVLVIQGRYADSMWVYRHAPSN